MSDAENLSCYFRLYLTKSSGWSNNSSEEDSGIKDLGSQGASKFHILFNYIAKSHSYI